MDDIKWERVGVLSAFVALGLSAVGFALVPIALPFSSSAQAIIDYFADNRQAILAQTYLGLLGIGALLWFIFSLRSYMRRFEGEPGRLSAATLGSGVMGLTIGSIGAIVPVALALRADSPLEGAIVRTVYDLGTVSNLISSVPFALMLGAVGLLALRKVAFPSWLGWASLAAALLHLVGASGFLFEEGPLSPGGVMANAVGGIFALWLIATAVVIYRRLGRLPTEST